MPPSLALPKFDPERMFRPRSVAVIGKGRLADLACANLASFPGPQQVLSPADTPEPADLAVIATESRPVTPLLRTLARQGIGAAVCLGLAPDIAAGQAETGVRVLGPGSFGVACPALRLNATLSHLQPLAGRVALVSQSAALCRAVLDWAEPNGVGFSQVVGIGGNAGTGFSAVLDFLSRDSSTGPILLDIRRIRDRRAFLSAARAAARLRPVVAIRAGGRLLDPSGRADAVFEAALKRAGVLTVADVEEMFAALETLTRAASPRGEALAIVTNATGPGRLAGDAAIRAGVTLAKLQPETRQVLRLAFADGNAGDIVYVGVAAPTRLADAAALLGGACEVGCVLAVLAPAGPDDAAGVAALAAVPRRPVPLLVCAMGETTGAAHRRTLAEAGVPAFASPEAAVRGFRHLLRDRRARIAARELPSSDVLQLQPDRSALARLVASARREGRLELVPDEASAVLALYGIGVSPVDLCVMDDAMFGPAIGLGSGSVAECGFDLPPLNLALAHALVGETRACRSLDAAAMDRLADTLVRVSQLVVDLPELASLSLTPGGATLRLRPFGEAARLAIAPYPASLVQSWQALTIRPIRPEDATAYRVLFERASPEDRRMRFFSAMREVSPERIARMTQVDYDREMVFVAERSPGDIVGGARLVCEAEEGEFAILVQPDRRGSGLARELMRRLLEWGRQSGLAAVAGQVLVENRPMLGFVRSLGFSVQRLPGEPEVVEARLALR